MTMAETLVDVLHVLRDVRRERNVYREIALCAIHRLHQQCVLNSRQRTHISRLRGELHDLHRERCSSSDRERSSRTLTRGR